MTKRVPLPHRPVAEAPALPIEVLARIVEAHDCFVYTYLSCMMVARDWRAAVCCSPLFLRWPWVDMIRDVRAGLYQKHSRLIPDDVCGDVTHAMRPVIARVTPTAEEIVDFKYRSAVLLCTSAKSGAITFKADACTVIARDWLLNGHLAELRALCARTRVPPAMRDHLAHLERCAAHQACIIDQRCANVLAAPLVASQ